MNGIGMLGVIDRGKWTLKRLYGAAEIAAILIFF